MRRTDVYRCAHEGSTVVVRASPDFHGALGFLTHHLGPHAYQGWHNDVFRACIYQQPSGRAFALEEVYEDARLDEDRLPSEAVRSFLTHVAAARRLDVAEEPDTWIIPDPA